MPAGAAGEPFRITLLGGLAVVHGGRTVTHFRSRKVAGLLATLAHFPDRKHSRDELVELLWPRGKPEPGRASLRQALASLRRELEYPRSPGALVAADRSAISLRRENAAVDSVEMQLHAKAAERAKSAADRAVSLEKAVELYRGELLPDLELEWLPVERARMHGIFVRAVRGLSRIAAERGDTARAIELSRRAIAAEPAGEEQRRDLMRLLVRVGDLEEAQREYRDLERELAARWTSPAAETRALLLEIHRRASSGAAAGAAAPAAVVRPESRRPQGTEPHLPEQALLTYAFVATGDGAGALPGVVASASRAHRGVEVEAFADHALLAFASPRDAIRFALELLGAAPPVRAALYTGEAELRHRAARLASAAHPGQVLCSEAAGAIARAEAPGEAAVVDLGAFHVSPQGAAERLFEIRRPGERAATPPPRAVRAIAGGLPSPLTTFFGREDEILALERSIGLGPSRVATITGPGGIGKTRLALEVGRRLLPVFGGAVFFVSLAELSDASLLLDAIVSALEVQGSASRPALERIADALELDRSLLVLDNFEHLLESGIPLLERLLERVPTLRCLLTSRERLRVPGELELALPPLPIPDPDATPERLADWAAVRLFVDRAQAGTRDFQVTPRNARGLAELVRRLDGIPLALELAASHARTLSISEMLSRLAAPFELLATRARGVPDRHRTLRAAIRWSAEALDPGERSFFAALSVFGGGLTPESAAEVTGEGKALELLDALVDRSLVRSEKTPPERRFRLLEPIREYAKEQLPEGDRAALRARHAAHFLALAERGREGLAGPDSALWLARLAEEHENLRAALEWALEAEGEEAPELGLRLAVALAPYWHRGGHFTEGRRVLNALLARVKLEAPGRGRALMCAGNFAIMQGESLTGRRLLEQSAATLRREGDRARLAQTLLNLAVNASDAGDFAEARAEIEESLAIEEERGNRRGVAWCQRTLARVSFGEGDFRRATRKLEEATDLMREIGDARGVSECLVERGHIAGLRGDFDEASRLNDEAIAAARPVDPAGVLWATLIAGIHLLNRGETLRARESLDRTLAEFRRLGDPRGTACALQGLGLAALDAREHVRARKMLVESVDALRASGLAAIAADSLIGIAELELREGWPGRARRSLEECLALEKSGWSGLRLPAALEGFAALAFAEGAISRAARLLGAAAFRRERLDLPLPPRSRASNEELVRSLRAAIGAEPFEAAIREGRGLDPERAVACARGESAPG